MSELLQSLYAASNRVNLILEDQGTHNATEDAQNTLLGTHDIDVDTLDSAHDTGDGTVLGPDITYVVTYGLDAAVVTGSIDFVRVVMKQAKYSNSELGDFSCSAAPYINGAIRGTPNTEAGSEHIEKTWDFTTDPVNGGSWSNTKINALTWGYYLRAASTDVDASATVECSEFWIEIWGSSGPSLHDTWESMVTTVLAQEDILNELITKLEHMYKYGEISHNLYSYCNKFTTDTAARLLSIKTDLIALEP